MKPLLLLLALGFISPAAASAARPNIVWITTEDLSPHLGSYGDAYAYTPALDQMAREGVLYTHAYASAPVCTPARSSIITGWYASSLGTQHLRGTVPLSTSIRCFTELMREAGYVCLNFNKEDYNFEAPENAWDYSSDWDNQLPPERFVSELANRSDDGPFFAVFNFFLTHQGQTRYGREELVRKSSRLPAEARRDATQIQLPPYYPDTPEVRENLAVLYTQVALLDEQVGALLADLERHGLAENTIVFFFSDHGDGLPRHKRWSYDSGLKVPFIIRFPQQFQHLSPVGPGEQDHRIVNFIDLAPTLLSLTGSVVPEDLPGSIFLGPAREERSYTFATNDRIAEAFEFIRSVSDGRYHYIRNFSNDRPRMQHCAYSEPTPIRRELRRLAASGQLDEQAGWLMEPTKPVEELYDTRTDPHQINNLAGDPAHQHILAGMKEKLFAWMIESRDLSLIPEPLMRKGAGGRSPKDAWRDHPHFQVEKVLRFADMKGRGPTFAGKLREGLRDESPIVRYWSAKGLGELGVMATAPEGELRRLLSDDSPVVRLATAEALCRIGDHPEAAQVMLDLLLHEDVVVRLYAAMSLPRIDLKTQLSQDLVARVGNPEKVPPQDSAYIRNLRDALKHAIQ